MPNELTIQPVKSVSGASESSAEPKSAPFAHPPPAQPAAGQSYPNPALRLDSSLGLVVLEFRNDAGAVTSSIPSQRQIQAYRTHQQTPPGRQAEPHATAGAHPLDKEGDKHADKHADKPAETHAPVTSVHKT